MSDVISLDEHRPHMTGTVRCLACGHNWHAVAPLGTLFLECPECHTEKGVWHRPVIPETYWRCHCGCAAFSLSDTNAYCMACGVTQVWPRSP